MNVLITGSSEQTGTNFALAMMDRCDRVISIEDPRRLGQRSQRRSSAAQSTLHLAQLAGLLNAAQTGDDGVEEIQKKQRRVLIAVQRAMAGLVASAGVAVKFLQHGKQQLEVLEAVKVLLFNRGIRLPWHGALSMRQEWPVRK